MVTIFEDDPLKAESVVEIWDSIGQKIETSYYRAHSAVRELKEGDFNRDEIFGKEGVRVFNSGGIYTLISLAFSGLAIEAMKKANEHGTFVSADLSDAPGYETRAAKNAPLNEISLRKL